MPRSPARSARLLEAIFTELLQQCQQFLAVSFEPSVVIVPLEEAGRRGILVLGDEEVVLVGLLLEAEGVDELVVLLEVVIVA